MKFNDANGNGVRDAGETGMAGVSIQLKAPSGQTLLATTASGGCGSTCRFCRNDAGSS